ncbi:MAG: fibronectin type III domain-containing protein, partial [candidate division Zixibacteria bacterium]|nr:fibronectin type III domain-containing protein [candidate division Zixibacteria bacterium]
MTSLAIGQETEEITADSIDIFVPISATNVVAVDHVYDRGDAVDLSWTLSTDDDKIGEYKIFRAEEGSPDFVEVGLVMPCNTSFTDKSVESGQSYIYKIMVVYGGGVVESKPSAIVIPDTEFINWNLLNLFVIGLLIAGAVVYFIAHA